MVLKKQLMHYMACVEETLGILDVDGYTHANDYFQQQLEPLAEKVLALTRVFQAETEQEIIHELAEIRTAVHNTIISSACISIIVLLIAVLLVYDNSRKTRLAIENKAQAATAANTTQPNIELLDRCTEAIEDNSQSDNKDFMDWEYIAAISTDNEVVDEILKSLLTVAPEAIEDIFEAIQASDAEQLKQRAHSFKGGALAVGASQLGEKAWCLEQAGEQNDLTQASELFEQLRAEYMKVQTFLEQPDFIETVRSRAAGKHVTHV
jgi:HPt (histidine-containing phosphotransfer) domain-containing protein